MRADMAAHHRETRKQYWESLSGNEFISTATEYGQEFGSYDVSSSGAADDTINSMVNRLLQDSHEDVFTRSFPFTDQPFMILTINPGMPDLLPYLNTGEGMLYNRCEREDGRLDPSQMAMIGAHYIVKWLRSTNFPTFLKRVVEQDVSSSIGADFLQMSPEEWDEADYFQSRSARYWRTSTVHEAIQADDSPTIDDLTPSISASIDSGILGDFYYSTAYKLSTPSESGIVDMELVQNQLRKEIEIADPIVLFTCGGKVYDQIRNIYKGDLIPQADSVLADGIMESRNGVFRVDQSSGPEYLVCLRHPNFIGNRSATAERLNVAGVFE